MTTKTEKVKRALLRKRKPISSEISKELLSTGSTLLNLACSGRVSGGFPKGCIILLVGDSDSGKTFLSLTCLAEATLSKKFQDYRLIYDGPEFGALMDLETFFGRKTVERIEAPHYDTKGNPVPSQYLEEMYYNLDDAIEDGRPFICVWDSIDGVEPKEDEAKFKQTKNAHRSKKAKKKEISGSYGTASAKINSRRLRNIAAKLPLTGSILVIIVQSRDALNAMFQNTKTRAGGRALKFYSAVEVWSQVKGEILKNVNGKMRQLGIYADVKVKRSRITGKHRRVVVPIFHSTGLDDLGGCIDYLIEESKWKKVRGKIKATGLTNKNLSREGLVRYVEHKGLQRELIDLVKETWDEIEARCRIRRKRKYD